MPEIELEFCSSTDPRFVAIRRTHYIAAFHREMGRVLTAAERETICSQCLALKKANDGGNNPVPFEDVQHQPDTPYDHEFTPLGFGDRGQQAPFLIWYRGELAGIIAGGSTVKATAANRNEFFKIGSRRVPNGGEPTWINGLVHNTVYCLVNHEKGLFGRVLSAWEKIVPFVWMDIYGVPVFGFDTFIEPDPSVGRGRGQGYLDTGWSLVGSSSGLAVHHPMKSGMNQVVPGKSTREYGQTIPKNTFCKWRKGFSEPIWCLYQSSWKATTPEEKRIAREKTAVRERLRGARCFVVDTWRVSIGGVTRDARAEFRAWKKAHPGTPEAPLPGPSQAAVAS